MPTLFEMVTQTHFNTMTESTPNASSVAWDAASALAGVNGDAKYTIVGGVVKTNIKTITPPGAVTGVSCRIYYDFSGITIGTSGQNAEFVALYLAPTTFLLRVAFRFVTGPTYSLRIGSYNDAGASTFTNYNISTNAAAWIECNIVRASSNVASDGTSTYTHSVDGVLGSHTGIDNYDILPTIDTIGMGVGTGGSLHASVSGAAYQGKLLVTDTPETIGAYFPPSGGGGIDSRANFRLGLW